MRRDLFFSLSYLYDRLDTMSRHNIEIEREPFHYALMRWLVACPTILGHGRLDGQLHLLPGEIARVSPNLPT